MNIDRIIQMAVRMLMRRGIDAGINKGTEYLAGRGKSPEEMTPEERQRMQSMRKQAGQARKLTRMGRRLR